MSAPAGGMSPEAARPLLRVEDLQVVFGSDARPVRAVDGVTFEIGPGEAVGLVGESGCGKSLTALSLARLTPEIGARCRGRIEWNGASVLDLSESAVRRLRGCGIAYVFQDPLTALNPVRRIGSQVAEAVRLHDRGARVRPRVLDLLAQVGLPDPARQARAYPHALSGGMRQRAVIAMALACRPRLLVADEPTTALDPTVQVQILDLIQTVRRELGMALLLVTHDLSLAWEHTERLMVMYAGLIVETGPAARVLDEPAHPYTRALLDSLPGRVPPGERLCGIPGAVPRPDAWPAGCRFHPRCSRADARCSAMAPAMRFLLNTADSRSVRCHHPLVGPVDEPRDAPEVKPDAKQGEWT